MHMPLKERLPNRIFYLALATLEDVLGKDGLDSVLVRARLGHYIGNFPPNTLDLEHPSTDFTRLLSAVVEILGKTGARLVMLRAGLRCFEIMYRDMPGLFALKGVEIRRGPHEKLFGENVRILTTIHDAGRHIFGNDIYKVDTVKDGWVLEIAPCYWCTGIVAEAPVCHGQVGFMLGLGHMIFGIGSRIEETHCIAKGDPACRFVVYRPAGNPHPTHRSDALLYGGPTKEKTTELESGGIEV
jgi:predicted hydrocarbon binding protein